MKFILQKYYRTLEDIFRDDLHIDLRESRFSKIVDLMKGVGIWNVKKFVGVNDFVKTGKEVFDLYMKNWSESLESENIYVYPELVNQIADILAELKSLPSPAYYDFGYWGLEALEYLNVLTSEGLDLFFVFFSYENLAEGSYLYKAGKEFTRQVDEEIEERNYWYSVEDDLQD